MRVKIIPGFHYTRNDGYINYLAFYSQQEIRLIKLFYEIEHRFDIQIRKQIYKHFNSYFLGLAKDW